MRRTASHLRAPSCLHIYAAIICLNLTVLSASSAHSRGPFDSHVVVLRLLYTLDFSDAILSAANALEMLSVTFKLLFDDYIKACMRFLEAVPWTEEEEEEAVFCLIPFLQDEESCDLLARVRPEMGSDGKIPSKEMLHGLILSAIHSHPKVAAVKAFVAKLLRDYPSRDTVTSASPMTTLTSGSSWLPALSPASSSTPPCSHGQP